MIAAGCGGEVVDFPPANDSTIHALVVVSGGGAINGGDDEFVNPLIAGSCGGAALSVGLAGSVAGGVASSTGFVMAVPGVVNL